ncbi:hypothetical protein LX99_02557 [Mucilaginibacter oryzae]|uniref:Uncharacterized protein n=1 Tax=Mucilaginibacter oryzae TaxID=468058 RepID=A0A316HB95_9SPHI|nr:hypothetical protein [Mucilaginibacter oryzae]PWK77677.1 hypothetical protein LX99_02557 [Mucilaginibacter oryzae]
MILVDLYTENYIGELEAVLVEMNWSDQIIYELKLFQADFNSIVDWIPYNETSHSENLVRILNLDLKWGADFSQVTRLQEFYDQLVMIENDYNSEDAEVYHAIKDICWSTLQHNNRLFIKINS